MAGGSTLFGGPGSTLFCQALVLFESILLILAAGSVEFSGFDFSVEPSDTVVVRGQPAILNCSAQHDRDSPEMQWVRDDVYINFDGENRRHLLSNGSLYFSTIIHSRSDRPDEGIYQCVATVDGFGTILSRKASLQVAYLGKEFEEEPESISVHLGDVAMFACHIDGAPKPHVRWYKDEMEINTEHVNYRIHQDGTLEISSVQFSDFGRYKCKAENIDRARTSKVAALSQNSDISTYQGVQPRFVMGPKDKTVQEGETVTLYCAANGRDRQGQIPSVTWLKDGSTIDMADLDSRFSIVGQGSLQVKDVTESDSGIYTCRFTNQEDSVDADAALVVSVPPRFKTQPRNLFAHENADVEFECDVYGVPVPTIKWMKDGDPLIPSDYFQIVDNRNLRILGLVNSDAGLYQCFAENQVGNVQASAQLQILKKDAPIPTSPQLTTPHTRAGYSGVDLSGDVPSAPTGVVAAIVSTRFVTLSWQMPEQTGSSEIVAYSVYWRETGSDRERVMNTTRLEANIQHLKPDTQYEVRVVAYNRAGPSKEHAEFTVTTEKEVNVPGEPQNLKVSAISPTSAKVKWDPPGNENGPITKYKLYYYMVGAEEVRDVDVNGHEYTLDDLSKFKEYSFRVVAFNNNGPGLSTEEVVARTLSDVPSEAPQNVTLETASSTSIIVRWEPPTEDQQNGIITGYKIRFKVVGGRGDTVTTDGNRRAYALSDLERGKSYQIRVQALTVNGSGPATTWLQSETYTHDLDESRVPGRPTSLRVRAFPTSIVVSWTPPQEQHVMVRGYILGYGKGIADVYKQVLDAKQRYHTIKGLAPSSEYVITLRAFNSMGEGVPVYETTRTREEEAEVPVTPMIPPVGLKAIVLTSTSIVVTWSDTTLGRNQRITDGRFYTVKYNAQGNRRIKYVNSTDLNVHIDDLRPNSDYEFSVKVIKGRRQSTWSLSVLNKTFEAAPNTAPRDLTPVAKPGEPTWVVLSWQPPRQPNGQVTGYLVFYTTDATQKDRDWAVEGVRGEKLTTTITGLTPETTYYYKVQARNSKGYGPMSPTVIFRTPKADGTGGGRVETPNDYGQNNNNYNTNGKSGSSRQQGNGLPPMVLWIVIGCVSGVTLLAVIVVVVILCKRRASENKKRKGYHPANKGVKGGPKESLKPPDLWIHDMEMKNIKGQGGGSMSGMTSIPHHGSQDIKHDDDGHPVDNPDEDRYRRPARAKPIMIPVDQPPPPREPIATAIPNGHLLGGDGLRAYPRTHYPNNIPPHPYSSTPRVNAVDLSQPSSDHENSYYSISTLERRRPPKHDKHRRNSGGKTTVPQSPLESPSTHNQHAPIPYDQLQHHGHHSVGSASPLSPPPVSGVPVLPTGTAPQMDGNKSLPHRSPHPLKSFSVPGPPSQTSAPSTPSQKHIVKPQQQTTSPYKKPNPPATTPIKPRSPVPVVTPKAPDVTLGSGNITDSEIPKSYSAEELTAEMANLEGLMKDLSAITQQQEFEC